MNHIMFSVGGSIGVMKMNDEMICKTCVYWEKHEDGRRGNCHRYPPMLVAGLTVHHSQVSDDDWCGEWEPKE